MNFIDWLKANDVSNQLGGGCLVSAIRITLITILVITIIIALLQ